LLLLLLPPLPPPLLAAAIGFSNHFVTEFSINKIHMRYNTSRSRIFKVVFVYWDHYNENRVWRKYQ
jgi:hypothetical protein